MAFLGLSMREGALVIFGALFAVVNIVWVLRNACALQAVRRFRDAAATTLGTCLQHLIRGRKKEEDESDAEVEKVVAEDVEKQKIARCLRISQVMCWPCLANVVLIISNVLRKNARVNTELQDVAFFVGYASLLCVQILPRVPDAIFVDFYYSLVMVCTTLFVSPWAVESGSVIWAVGTGNIIFILLNVWSPSFFVAAFWTAGLVTSALASLLVNSPLPGISNPSLNNMVFFYILAGVCVVALGRLLEAHMWAETRARVKHEATREVHSAACALLRSFCDVVVELDAEGRITGDGYTVGGYLLRGCSLKGLRFDSLLSNEDGREAILKKLKTPKNDRGSLADVIHVNMRDGNGTDLPMEAFWFDYKGIGGQFRCLAGLRRFGDASPAATDKKEEEDCIGEQEVYAVVLTNLKGIPIMYHSAGFGIKIDRFPRGAPFLNYVENEREFIGWLQKTTMAIVFAKSEGGSGSSRGPATLESFRITLATRKGRATATVTAAVHEDWEEEHDSAIPPMRLSFSDIHLKPAHGIKTTHSMKEKLSRHSRGDETGSCTSGSESGREGSGQSSRQLGTTPWPTRGNSGDLARSSTEPAPHPPLSL